MLLFISCFDNTKRVIKMSNQVLFKDNRRLTQQELDAKIKEIVNTLEPNNYITYKLEM